MNKYEQLIEHIINDEEAKARALFHEIVVEKSRDIYESLMDEELAEDQEGPADLLAAVEEEIARPGRSTDNLRDVLNATFGSDRSPEFKKARAVIGKYLDLVDNASVGSEEDGIAPMRGGDIARYIQQYDLADHLQHAAAMLDKAVKGPMGEAVGGDQVESMVDEIAMDETNGIGEGEDGDMDMGDMDMGDEQDLEQKVMDLESELEALKAEFEQLMGDEEGDMDDMGDMDPMAMGDKEEEEEEEEEEEGYSMMEEEVYESTQRRPLQKTAVDLMREYVEKIGTNNGPMVGSGAGGDRASGNDQSIVAGKNDMGGTAKNLVQGTSESAPDGTSAPKKGTVKDVKDASNWENKPGANAGKAFSHKAKAKAGEDGGINKHSIEPGGN